MLVPALALVSIYRLALLVFAMTAWRKLVARTMILHTGPRANYKLVSPS